MKTKVLVGTLTLFFLFFIISSISAQDDDFLENLLIYRPIIEDFCTCTSSGGSCTCDDAYVNTTGDTMTGNLVINTNLTVDTSTLFVDSLNNYVGIKTATPTTPLHIDGTTYDVRVDTSGRLKADIIEQNAGAQDLRLQTESGTGKDILLMPDGTGKVGIGTATPGQTLEVYGDVRFNDAGGVTKLSLGSQAATSITGNGVILGLRGTPITFSNFATGALEMTVNNGNVGIGVNDPDTMLEVVGEIHVQSLEGSYSNGEAYVCVYDNGTIFAKDSACS